MATENTPVPGQESGEQLPLDEPSLRDTLDEAFQQHATEDAPDPAGGRVRDPQGRFAKAADGAQEPRTPAAGTNPTVPGATAPVEPPGKPIQPAPAPVELKAPASWTPAAREKWAGVDPEIRSEIHRRELENQRVLQESAGLRDFAKTFQSIVAPYEMFIRAENSDPLGAVSNLLNTAGQLRVGTPQQKVGIVASIIQQHGIDLKMLDDTLARVLGITDSGQMPQQALRDPRVDQLLAQQQQQAWQQQQQAQQRDAWETEALRQGLTQFAQTHEFYLDVAETMADLVDAATKRGQQVDLEKIYTRACQMDEQVSTILAQRGGTPAAPNGRGQPPTSPAVLRAKRAAASVKSDPSPQGATVPKNDSVRAAIEAAFDAHSG